MSIFNITNLSNFNLQLISCNIRAKGYDGAKKVKGRKRYIITDTQGFILGCYVRQFGIRLANKVLFIPQFMEGLDFLRE